MDDKLAAWDRYVEDVAEFLGVDVPMKKIRYSWVPGDEQSAARWPCEGRDTGCTRGYPPERSAVVFAGELEMLHELVHAVEIPRSNRAHPVFNEGMADYLSKNTSKGVSEDFADEFTAMIEKGPDGLDYAICMHFVGSIVQRFGVERYQEFRARVPLDARIEEFAGAYEAVFDEAFADGLAMMAVNPVVGRWLPWGCEPEAEALPWPSEGTLDVTIGGKCGDGGFYGGGFVAGQAGFSKNFAVDVEVAGFYDGVQLAGSAAAEYDLAIVPCRGVGDAGIFASDSQPFSGLLHAGRYSLQVWFPASEASGAEITLAVTMSFAVL